jgi:hypothetical protein
VAQTVVDRGNVYALVGEHTAAVEAYERAYVLNASVMQRTPTLTVTVWSRAAWIALALLQQYLGQRDPDSIAHISQQRLKPLLADVPRADAEDRLNVDAADMIQPLALQVDHYPGLATFLVPLHQAVHEQEKGNEQGAQRLFDRALGVWQE